MHGTRGTVHLLLWGGERGRELWSREPRGAEGMRGALHGPSVALPLPRDIAALGKGLVVAGKGLSFGFRLSVGQIKAILLARETVLGAVPSPGRPPAPRVVEPRI